MPKYIKLEESANQFSYIGKIARIDKKKSMARVNIPYTALKKYNLENKKFKVTITLLPEEDKN